MDTLKTTLKQLQINPANWLDLAGNRPAWRRTVRLGAAIYDDNRIAAAKAKMAARNSPAPRVNAAHDQALLTCPRCQRNFRARIGLDEHLQTHCNNNPTTSTSANPHSYSPPRASLAPIQPLTPS
ncbi:unnamed protein product [Schistocephalus solidus]|uniref:C2H2-type domain-containing protein n=1 Tax=Schistocephalus solidus TaxID=70667 RepID=A0A183TEU2_SCHSO|nr:unnamed protein product [Schistocephalus solidus]